jgi:CheY-like chemotaxis protein/Tfp pilus assembly protein PilZ
MADALERAGAVVLVGAGDATQSASIEAALGEVEIPVEHLAMGKDLAAQLEQAAPRAVVMSGTAERVRGASLIVRGSPALSPVPIVWMTPANDDLVFAEAFTVGADDVVGSCNIEGLVRRLRALPSDLAQRSTPTRGTALIADADRPRRVVMARLLRNVGFDVTFAISAGELAERARAEGLTVVIADVDLEEGRVLGELDVIRRSGNRVPWILHTPPKKLSAAAAATRDLDGAWVSDAFAPPENVLYAINEAMRGSFAENRASPRLLYATIVAFRVAGRDQDDIGFIFNVSQEGLYIRTMAPLTRGDDAWLELTPPRTERRVRLEAEVVWRRPYGPATDATAPPGFGVRITGGSEKDLERYRQGYRSLVADLAGLRFSSHPSNDAAS